jgi:hypothetical protein
MKIAAAAVFALSLTAFVADKSSDKPGKDLPAQMLQGLLLERDHWEDSGGYSLHLAGHNGHVEIQSSGHCQVMNV